jgi:hypothetical protein
MTRRTLQRVPDPRHAPPVSIATRRDLFGTIGALLLLTAAEAGDPRRPSSTASCCPAARRRRRSTASSIGSSTCVRMSMALRGRQEICESETRRGVEGDSPITCWFCSV